MLSTLGWQELVIILVVLAISWIPALGFYRTAKRVGYDGGTAVLWAIGYMFAAGIMTLILGFIDWPRDRQTTPPTVPTGTAALPPQ